jgi:hypothetical protein
VVFHAAEPVAQRVEGYASESGVLDFLGDPVALPHEPFSHCSEVDGYLKLRSALAKAKDELEQKLKPRSVQEEFICAWRKGEKSHVARQLDKLLEVHSIADFEGYFGNPENMAALRRLSMGV